jgi:hypothetical protein
VKYMVFDVESIGLHGEAFAWGYVVVDETGERLDEQWAACHPGVARGDDDDRRWVSDNIPRFEAACESPTSLRGAFWLAWMQWKQRGAILVSDCGWPVEARFLAACVDDDPVRRKWDGPYPLHDLASVILARGREPLETNTRLDDERPEHHPLADARQSARLLVEALWA